MLLEKLVKIQWDSHMSDEEFSNHLGISRSLWNAIKNKRRQIGKTLIAAALSKYPDLKDDIAIFLVSNATIVSNNAAIETENALDSRAS